jgi:hypothetical protein
LHRLCGADVRLFPADHPSALLRYANLIGPIELLLVSADLNQPVWSAVSRHLPHVANEATRVLLAQGDGFRAESFGQLQARLGVAARRLAA